MAPWENWKVCITCSFIVSGSFLGLLKMISFSAFEQDIVSDMIRNASTEMSNGNTVRMQDGKCLTFEFDLDSIIASSRQVFIIMPAKAGGTSLKHFVNIRCANRTDKSLTNNILNNATKLKELIASDSGIPKVLASHIGKDLLFQKILARAGTKTTVIYMWRDEASRLASAIKMIATFNCFHKQLSKRRRHPYVDDFYVNGTKCIVDAKPMIKLIESYRAEMGFSNTRVLSCRVYENIRAAGLRVVFVDHKQSDRLQDAIAKHHCPQHKHVHPLAHHGGMVFIRRSDGKLTSLEEWVGARKHTFEFVLVPAEGLSDCKGKTRSIAEGISHCQDHIMQLAP